MATNRLIQYLEKERFSAFPGGASEGIPNGAMDRQQNETFFVALSPSVSTTLTLAVGDLVTFNYVDGGDSESVISVKKSEANGSVMGVCLENGTSITDAAGKEQKQEKVKVALAGICEAAVEGKNAAGNSAIAAGDYLCQGAVAGVLYKFTPGTDAVPHAIAMDDVASAAAAANVTVIMLKAF